jgi:ClpP class serine protease
VTLISAGTYKTEGNPFEPLSDEALAVKQALVDAAYGQFVKAVARGRGVTPAAVRGGYGEGRALSAPTRRPPA